MQEFIAEFVGIFFELWSFVILARVLLSWFGSPYNQFTELIYRFADPVLNVFKRWIPPIGMIDISPIFALFALSFLGRALPNLILSI